MYPETITETELADGIQPIRFFALAQALHAFLQTGAQGFLKKAGTADVSELSGALGLDVERTQGLMQYLANEEYVNIVGGTVALTVRGAQLDKFEPWYSLLVGGYATSLDQLMACLRDGQRYATRDGASVGAGSCGISRHDALPMTRQLLAEIEGRYETLVDIGCGDGTYLAELCSTLPGVTGLGFDPEAASVRSATEHANALGVGDRVTFRVSSAQSLRGEIARLTDCCFVVAFVLQEVLEQSGRQAAVDLLSNLVSAEHRRYCVVIEVDHRPGDTDVMNTPLGLAYYNPYYLLHQITEQRLEPAAFWYTMFEDAGVHPISECRPDPSYDSLGLKMGFLLGNPQRAAT
jgi:2-ketoarginine methyltransferase